MCYGGIAMSESESLRRRREIMDGTYQTPPPDIVDRLRRWSIAADAPPASDLMDEAAAEIERLRAAIRRLAEQDATLSACEGNVTVTLDATLTDAEREAIEVVATVIGRADPGRAQALLGLLERTNGGIDDT